MSAAAVEVDYDIPLTFPDGAKAYRWAIEMLERQGTPSMWRAIQHKLLPRRARFAHADLVDLALTISSLEAHVGYPEARTVFRSIYASHLYPNIEREAVEILVRAVDQPTLPRRIRRALPRLSLAVLQAEWRWRVKGRKTPQAAFARMIKVHRDTIRKSGWPQIITALQFAVRGLCDAVEVPLTDELAQRGVVG